MKKLPLYISIGMSGIFSCYAQGIGQFTPVTTTVTFSPFTSLIALLQKILGVLTPLIIGIALLGFFWFLIIFIWKSVDNPEERKKAISGMTWSIIALFCMVAVWGIIQFAAHFLGIGLGGQPGEFKLPGEV